MNFAFIYDNNHYQVVQLLASDKKFHLIRELTPANTKPQDKKIKPDHLIASFNDDPQTWGDSLLTLQQAIDLPLLWELASEQENWLWDDLTNLNFTNPGIQHKLAIFQAIVDPAIYFTWQGNNQFKRCNPEEVKMRQLQHQRQLEYQAQFDSYYQKLINLQRPEWQIDPLTLLNTQNKNQIEYKALNKAAKELKISVIELLFKLSYITSIEDWLVTSFIKHHFPQGVELAEFTIDDHATDLPLRDDLVIFSIDDATTTEIDDAFSVQTTADGYIIGIHIAAPALNEQLLPLASERLSTVYFPGHKITMLPTNVINHYSLDQGKCLPVVSIYFQINQQLEIVSHHSSLERVTINSNLRTESLEQFFNHDNLEIEHGYPFEKELKLLFKFATSLEEKRGRPSVNQLSVDYNFSFEPDGKIVIKPRSRGNPIDKIVSELMILANGSWGRMLTNAFIPAIYRVKQPMQPVVMTLTPNSHTGLNVDYYTWASSPLRRAVDIVNQAQIINLLMHKKPLTATDPTVAYVVENFDTTYATYLKFQDQMERYWSLRYLEQEQISEVTATFTFRNNVQLSGVPITLDLSGVVKPQAAGSQIKLAITNLNFVNQSFDYQVVE